MDTPTQSPALDLGGDAPRLAPLTALDLDAFKGFTPGPLPTTPSERHPKEQVLVAECYISLADKRLYDAAPALLAECVRQRERIALLEGAIEGLLFDWTNGDDARRVEAEAQALLEESSNE